MRTPPVPTCAFFVTVATLISCAGSDLPLTGGSDPTTGSILVIAQTGGVGTDTDGYLVQLDGAAQGAIGENVPVVLTGLTADEHTLALEGVVPFCAVEGGPARTVTVLAGDTAVVSFTISCRATGRIDVAVSTSGGTPDLDGYSVIVDGVLGPQIDPNGALSVPDVPAGTHAVSLSGLAFNCQVSDPNPLNGSVTTGAATPMRFAVSCRALAPWTPVVQAWARGTDEYHGQWDLFAVELESGAVTGLTQTREFSEESPELSPDRTQVAFVRTDDWDPRIGVVNVDGTDLRWLVAGGWPVTGSPRWSPDGSKLAFGRGSLHVINADGTGEKTLGSYTGARWSPDGTRFAAIGGPDDWNPDIWIVPADGGPQVNLTRSASPETEAVWSPDGRQLAFTRRTMRGQYGPGYYEDVWVMNANSLYQRRLTSSSGAPDYAGARRPRWSPDGKLVMFESSSLGYNEDIYTIRPDGTGLLNLTNTPDLSESGAEWSPDGTKILFRSEGEVSVLGGGVFIMNADGSGRVQL